MSSAELPLAKYASNVVFLSFLLGSTTLFLPRTSVSTGMVQRSSADRPEHPFLMPLTLDPLRTMLWQTGGTMVVMAWWGTRLRAWWFPRAKKDGVREKGETMGQVTVRMGRSLVMTILVSLLIMPLLMALGAPLDE
ncbi:hypothetical protein BD324DRAFT_647814 [Kockovaella imperatae]|uniref:Uncharacterized protein n=1 Tax=Kockovaella imperatae TaxID=4999 RepID=A0A1Y1USB2_9TREE|nr:hypothetical protein BD324DRAFT_647814 [Kockovaella imperatae]ORX40910.1 hypothetical protein BD324DRAFT_647814 [Kockovaella imperatae]